MKTIINLVCIGLLSLFVSTHVAAKTAVVVLKGDVGVNGTVIFQEHEDGIKITGNITGLTPNALRGFHVHEFGDLTNGCTSTGSHYNPFNKTHGAPTDKNRHVGDLGNIKSDKNGVAKLDFHDKVIKLSGKYSIVGRGVVVHAGTDDLGHGNNTDTHTTGNAGARSACGVIGLQTEAD